MIIHRFPPRTIVRHGCVYRTRLVRRIWLHCEGMIMNPGGRRAAAFRLCGGYLLLISTMALAIPTHANSGDIGSEGTGSGVGSGSEGSGSKNVAWGCPWGFTGPDCLPCKANSYSAGCNMTCNLATCSYHGRCGGLTGTCKCDEGWTGKRCETKALDAAARVTCSGSMPCPAGHHHAARARGSHVWRVSSTADFAFRVFGSTALHPHDKVYPTPIPSYDLAC